MLELNQTEVAAVSGGQPMRVEEFLSGVGMAAGGILAIALAPEAAITLGVVIAAGAMTEAGAGLIGDSFNG